MSVLDGPLSAKASFVAAVKQITFTADSHVFEAEINTVATIGWIKRKRMWIVCDGQGKMYITI